MAGPNPPEATCAGAWDDVMADGNVDACLADRNAQLANALLSVSSWALGRPMASVRLREIQARSH